MYFIIGQRIQILTAFSIYENGRKLFTCKKSESTEMMDCLNGIRVLSMAWVVLGHKYIMFLAFPTINIAYVPEVNEFIFIIMFKVVIAFELYYKRPNII